MVFGVEGGDTETPKKAYHLAPEREIMQGLFIGQTYIDVTFLTNRMPTGDEKHVASAYAISFGGNAVTAAFCCAKLGIVPDLITTDLMAGALHRLPQVCAPRRRCSWPARSPASRP